MLGVVGSSLKMTTLSQQHPETRLFPVDAMKENKEFQTQPTIRLSKSLAGRPSVALKLRLTLNTPKQLVKSGGMPLSRPRQS